MDRNSAQGSQNEIWWKAVFCQLHALFEGFLRFYLSKTITDSPFKLHTSNVLHICSLKNSVKQTKSQAGMDVFDKLSRFFTGNVAWQFNTYYFLLWKGVQIKKKKEEEKNHTGDFKCTTPPDSVIPCGLSTLYRCSLITVAHDTYHEKLLIRDCCNHKGSCTLFKPYSAIAAGISSSSFVRVSTRQLAVSSLSKEITSTLNFHKSNGTDGSRTRNLSHSKRAPYRFSWLDFELTK